MRYVSQTQPYCRCCGKPIKKFTVTHYFGSLRGGKADWSQHHPEPATTKAEAQRYINQKIVSIRYGYQGNIIAGAWDGETYEAGDFHSLECAAAFGRMAADIYPGLLTQTAYDAAKARQGG